MLREWFSSWRMLPALLLCACGPAQESDAPVLYAPPPSASGNVLDSTAYMGRVELGSAVQTRFTTSPRHLSFGFSVRAGAQVKLAVTHPGSSESPDTALFVYGPRQADGGYGSVALGQDDNSDPGQPRRVSALAQGGDYLVVVSTVTGAGKPFRLQLDCLNEACAPRVDPALYATCDVGVATHIAACVQGTVAEYGVSLADAYDTCTGPDDAHAVYREACNGGGTAPAWCQGGETQFTQRMWPVCQRHAQPVQGSTH